MEKGFADIIANGIQSSQQSQDRNFATLGQGLGGMIRSSKQKGYANEQKDFFTQRQDLENDLRNGWITPEFHAQEIDKLDNATKYHNMDAQNRGLKPSLTAQDYERRDKAEMAAKQAEAAAELKARQDAEDRELKVLDSFKDTDLLQFDALKEHKANNSLFPETREQLINAIAKEEGVKNDEARQRLLGELSEPAANKLRDKVEAIAKSAGTEFNQALKGAMGGDLRNLPKLLAAIPAVMAQGWAGKDTDSAIRIKNAIDGAFDDTLDNSLIERAQRRYTPEQMNVGLSRSRNRDYGTRKDGQQSVSSNYEQWFSEMEDFK